MRITLMAVGKVKKKYFKAASEEYEQRLSRYTGYHRVEVKDGSTSGARAPLQVKAREAEALRKRMPAGARLILLDERGPSRSTVEFASWIRDLRDRGQRDLVFAIGGAYGFDETLRQDADQLLNLSPFTMPHELARVVLLEQLYRAHTVIAGEPYHNA